METSFRCLEIMPEIWPGAVAKRFAYISELLLVVVNSKMISVSLGGAQILLMQRGNT